MEKILLSIPAYAVFKQKRRQIKRNPTYVYAPRERAESDLIDMRKFATKNKNYTMILATIDCYSRKLFTVPVKAKTVKELLDAFKETLLQMGSNPKHLCFDKEKAIWSKEFQNFCKQQSIQVRSNNNLLHCSFIGINIGHFSFLIYKRLNLFIVFQNVPISH